MASKVARGQLKCPLIPALKNVNMITNIILSPKPSQLLSQQRNPVDIPSRPVIHLDHLKGGDWGQVVVVVGGSRRLQA